MWRSLRSDNGVCGLRRPNEDGAVLLLVILVLALISVLVMGWAQEWRTELQLATNYRETHQCHRLAEAGVYYALGKLLETKIMEVNMGRGIGDAAAKPAEAWQGDRLPHRLELPGGVVEVRVEDEGGKLQINQVDDEPLKRLFTALGLPATQIPIMVDSLQDWRSRGNQPRPYGAKSAYYLKLDPPYVARNGAFETVEELSWVRGFENSALALRLSEFLTAQPVQGININTAPVEVLVAAGLPPDIAQALLMTRQQQPLRSFQDIVMMNIARTSGQVLQLGFQSSPFFTIKSTGMVNIRGARQTVKAIVRLDLSIRNAWDLISWVDDYPG